MIKYIVTTKKGRRLKLEIDVSGALRDGVTHELVKGQNNPMRGWYSPILYVKRPSYAIAVEVRFTGSVRVETRIDKAPRRYFPGLRILIKGYCSRPGRPFFPMVCIFPGASADRCRSEACNCLNSRLWYLDPEAVEMMRVWPHSDV